MKIATNLIVLAGLIVIVWSCAQPPVECRSAVTGEWAGAGRGALGEPYLWGIYMRVQTGRLVGEIVAAAALAAMAVVFMGLCQSGFTEYVKRANK